MVVVLEDHNKKIDKILKDLDLWFSGDYDGSLADFRGLNLRNVDLSGIDLSHSNFKSMDLSCANFTNCNLTGANLSYTNLSRAKLDGATLESTNIAYCLPNERQIKTVPISIMIDVKFSAWQIYVDSFGNSLKDWRLFDDDDILNLYGEMFLKKWVKHRDYIKSHIKFFPTSK